MKTQIPALGFIAAFVASVSLGPTCWSEERDVDGGGWNASYETVLDHWLEARIEKLGIPGLGVAIVHGDDVLYCKGVGFANIEERTRVGAETKFRIGSQSKLFTAIAIMQLVERNGLRLDSPVKNPVDWLPELKGPDERDEDITVRQLLTHTSGLSSMTVDRPVWTRLQFPDDQDLKRDLTELRPRLIFSPNEKLKYSNLGYVLLGEVIESVSKRAYAEYVAEHILQPMGLSDTSVDVAARGTSLAIGYEPIAGRRFRKIKPYSTNVMAAAAGFVSTPMDMARFLKWQLSFYGTKETRDESIINGATLREMQRPKRMTADLSTGCGYGFWITSVDGGTLIGHGGQMPGYFSHSAIDVDNRLGIALMANGMRCPVNPGESGSIMDGLFNFVRKAVATKTPSQDVNPEWKAYYGRYQSTWGTLQVTSLNGQLIVFDPEAAEPLATLHVLEAKESWGPHAFRVSESTDSFYLGEKFVFEDFTDAKAQNLRDPGANFPRVE